MDPQIPKIGDPAPDAVVFTSAGEEVRLAGRFTGTAKVALVFLRHYG
ncbi:MAG: hypothetical protein ABR507_03465 [Actinomycetota bacterium]|nr:hypothetical protein [Actinomycetota bacterium]